MYIYMVCMVHLCEFVHTHWYTCGGQNRTLSIFLVTFYIAVKYCWRLLFCFLAAQT